MGAGSLSYFRSNSLNFLELPLYVVDVDAFDDQMGDKSRPS